MAGLVPATSRLPSPACILCSSSAVKFFGGFLTCTRAYLQSGLSLATNTAATRMFMQYAANQCIMRIYALIPVPQDRRRIAIAMVSRLHSYIIALRSLWYRASKAMVSRLESYGIAPRKLCYRASIAMSSRLGKAKTAVSAPFFRAIIAISVFFDCWNAPKAEHTFVIYFPRF